MYWLDSPFVKPVIKILLQDKTTKENILFATNDYANLGEQFLAENHITVDAINMLASEIKPRVLKSREAQQLRTKAKAEVMTPAWIVCLMNGHCDSEWFGRPDVFEHMDGQSWQTTDAPIVFPEDKSWKSYVDDRRMEITCGEAPYIVTRYDTTTGEPLPLERRVGFLDHKLRIVNENADTEEEWYKWAVRAFQSSYGYEFQGDNLLIARVNLLLTFCEYLEAKWLREPSRSELRRIANIIAWNILQMDAFTGTIPYGEPKQPEEEWHQLSFDLFTEGKQEDKKTTPLCLIRDWRVTGTGGRALTYNSLKGE